MWNVYFITEVGIMTANARRGFKAKAKLLLKLYSMWHETHRQDIQMRCLNLLGELMAADPKFSLRREFQIAF